VFLDAAQSFLKLPIDMSKWHIDAVFFSLHKIGGSQGLGILIIDTRKKFKPLIAGFQQNNLRGGTLDILSLIEFPELLSTRDNIESRKDRWIKIKQELDQAGLEVYNPSHKHLFNTFLISTKGRCPLNLINILASQRIYVGNISACANEKTSSKTILGGLKAKDKFEKAIRIYFKNASDINSSIVKTIIDTTNEYLSDTNQTIDSSE
jgi:cysteine desulfurase